MERVGDLEVDQDMRVQETAWRIQRIGWAFILTVVVLALAGLFGPGPLSWTDATAAGGGLRVEYERFVRLGGSTDLVVEVGAAHVDAEGRFRVELPDGYVDGMVMNAISPRPDSVEETEDGLLYTFQQSAPGASLSATFRLTPDALWRQSGGVRLGDDGPGVTFWQLVYP